MFAAAIVCTIRSAEHMIQKRYINKVATPAVNKQNESTEASISLYCQLVPAVRRTYAADGGTGPRSSSSFPAVLASMGAY